jgi:hypothetical protein
MKTVDVIKQASENSPLKAKSSILRWEPASRSLLIRQGGQWRPVVSLFDGVLIQYIKAGDSDGLSRYVDRNAFCTFVEQQALTRLHLFVPLQLPCSVEERTPSRVAMLRGVIDSAAPKVDGNLYWQWAFQHMLITYCSAVRSAAAALESKLNSVVTSPAYLQLSSAMAALSDTVCHDRVLNYAADCDALTTSMDKLRQSLYSLSSMTGVAYSAGDSSRYSRPVIKAKLVTVDVAGNWGGSGRDHSYDLSIRVENPAKLVDHWPDLVSVLASVGIEEPTPYGLPFTQDNIAALASLIDVAKLDYAEPQKWRDAATGVTTHESTPVSAMEFA